VVLGYSTYLGGSTWESGNGIAVDASGSAYVVGSTQSTNFPATAGTAQTVFGGPVGGLDAFVAKFNQAGNTLVYATYLGGNTDDIGLGIAVDTLGNAYVTGETSGNFPLLNAFQSTFNAVNNAFVTKLNTTGALAYSTYLGGTVIAAGAAGSGSDLGVAIVVDNAGNAYVAGNASSTDFPTTANKVQVGLNGTQNAFVAKYDANGVKVYSTLLGGSVSETAWGIAVDPAGAFIYVAGDTSSSDFPVTTGTITGATDAFVSKINPAVAGLPGLAFSTFRGGAGNNSASGGIALDAAGNFYVAGDTDSLTFPTTTGAFQTTIAGASNAFVTKYDPTGAVVYSTLLGGSTDFFGSPSTDTAWWLAVDSSSGNAYVTGETSSTNFPIVKANTFKATLPGFSNAFVTKINPQGTGLIFSTYLGGTNSDVGFGLALDVSRRVYVTGAASSSDFPVRGGINPPATVFPGTGGSSAFVTQLNEMTPEPMLMLLDILL
jgi:hypothetical protein